MVSVEKPAEIQNEDHDNLGRHVAIQETTQIPVYQVADPFSPLDVPLKLQFGSIVINISICQMTTG